MMEVCLEFYLTRDTFHTAINCVDRYLSIEKNVRKSDL